MMRIPGKIVGTTIYVHKEYAEDVLLHFTEGRRLARAIKEAGDFPYTIIKFNRQSEIFSFIECENFDKAPEPDVGRSLVIHPNNEWRVASPSGKIYHHKWLMVGDDYDGFDIPAAIKRTNLINWCIEKEVARGNKKVKSLIGQKEYWLDFLRRCPKLKQNPSSPEQQSLDMVRTWVMMIAENYAKVFPNRVNFAQYFLDNMIYFKNVKQTQTRPQQQCYTNAIQELIHKNAIYVEGYLLGLIPFHHAWSLDKKGQPYDSTKFSKVLGSMVPDEYVGIEIPPEVLWICAHNKAWGVVTEAVIDTVPHLSPAQQKKIIRIFNDYEKKYRISSTNQEAAKLIPKTKGEKA